MTRFAVPEPYRLFFPLGVLYALLGAALWPLYAAGWVAYPAVLHWTLMVQGFLHCFVLGFLLTALPAFLHAEKTRPAETAAAAGSMIAFGALAVAGLAVMAQAFYLLSLAVALQACIRRLPARRGDPPEEFLFAALGLLFAVAGGVASLLSAAGVWTEPAPRFSLHLLTKGMMLSIVLGLGGLLVPTFSAMREPLVIPGLARPGQRLPRRVFYLPMAGLLVWAAVLEGTGNAAIAAWLRAGVATLLGLLVWKLLRRPGRRDLLSWTIWSAGWVLLAGLWIAALVPGSAVPSFHAVFLGGFALLIMGIATRVVVTHGGYPFAHEKRVLRPFSVAALGFALLARIGAEFAPASVNLHYALSGALWIAAWCVWAWGAIGCMGYRRSTSFRVLASPSASSLTK